MFLKITFPMFFTKRGINKKIDKNLQSNVTLYKLTKVQKLKSGLKGLNCVFVELVSSEIQLQIHSFLMDLSSK